MKHLKIRCNREIRSPKWYVRAAYNDTYKNKEYIANNIIDFLNNNGFEKLFSFNEIIQNVIVQHDIKITKDVRWFVRHFLKYINSVTSKRDTYKLESNLKQIEIQGYGEDSYGDYTIYLIYENGYKIYKNFTGCDSFQTSEFITDDYGEASLEEEANLTYRDCERLFNLRVFS